MYPLIRMSLRCSRLPGRPTRLCALWRALSEATGRGECSRVAAHDRSIEEARSLVLLWPARWSISSKLIQTAMCRRTFARSVTAGRWPRTESIIPTRSGTHRDAQVMRSRAWRRHHESRIKHLVRQYYGGYAKNKPRHLGRIARTRRLCSCWMCGNPRRHMRERSLQERRAFQPEDLW